MVNNIHDERGTEKRGDGTQVGKKSSKGAWSITLIMKGAWESIGYLFFLCTLSLIHVENLLLLVHLLQSSRVSYTHWNSVGQMSQRRTRLELEPNLPRKKTR